MDKIKIGTRNFKTEGHTYVMGILNVTPDSFSDGGKFDSVSESLYHVREMINEGVDIIDIGGESTRPGYVKISDEEEIERVAPVIKSIKENFDIPLSIDTYKSSVAEVALREGADLVNDIWGLKADGKMAHVIAQADVPCCIMHNRSSEKYWDVMLEVKQDLEKSLIIAEQAGISNDKIILDPGIGFGKQSKENLMMIARLKELKTLGYPLLLGASLKSVIGNTLTLPVDQRLEGTLVTTVYAVRAGAMFVRVHNVKENVRAIKMTEALIEHERNKDGSDFNQEA